MTESFNKRYSLQNIGPAIPGSSSLEKEILEQLTFSDKKTNLNNPSMSLSSQQSSLPKDEPTQPNSAQSSSQAAGTSKPTEDIDTPKNVTSALPDRRNSQTDFKPKVTAQVISTTDMSKISKSYSVVSEDKHKNSMAAKLRKKLMRRSMIAEYVE
ncbi:hypothetical protein BB560_001595 [Smittium megazygosporum]|uniref:Uncharacterized protein n=1 Tax=Smittium megazygosporum TaxID=133381 RepID=A0A2T9ZH74_9FUNG|nr:hypothetical protein BB560_001597 [Smittium megazygosporum]PVV03910.1 hypothetical protein BB560_001595 [Smittium megazygosporum]